MGGVGVDRGYSNSEVDACELERAFVSLYYEGRRLY